MSIIKTEGRKKSNENKDWNKYTIQVLIFMLLFVGKVQRHFIREKIKNFDSSQKVLKLDTKIKTPCIFRIHIYKTVNEFSMCFSCR